MPWQERSPVDLRLQFMSEYLSEAVLDDRARGAVSGSAARRPTNGSRGTRAAGRRGLGRLIAAAAWAAVGDATPRLWWRRCCALRRRHPALGRQEVAGDRGRQLQPRAAWPSRSTVCDLLRRHGLDRAAAAAAARCRMGGTLWRPSRAPNETWTTDFKGEFRTGDGALLLSVDPARRLQSLCPALRCPAQPRTRGHAPLLRARVCHVWVARADAQ